MPLMMTIRLTVPDDAAERVADVLAAPGTVLELNCIAGPVTARPVRRPSDPPAAPSSLPAVIAAIAAQSGVTADQIMGRSRYTSITRARQMAMLIAQERLRMSTVEIGQFFGRDHTTVLDGLKRIRASILQDAAVREVHAAVLLRLDGGAAGAP